MQLEIKAYINNACNVNKTPTNMWSIFKEKIITPLFKTHLVNYGVLLSSLLDICVSLRLRFKSVMTEYCQSHFNFMVIYLRHSRGRAGVFVDGRVIDTSAHFSVGHHIHTPQLTIQNKTTQKRKIHSETSFVVVS